MKFKIIIFTAIFLTEMLFNSIVYAVRIYPSAGSTSATFLKLPLGPKAVSMAGAYTSVSGDIYSMYYNPAGLNFVDNSLSIMHNDYVLDMNQLYIAYANKSHLFDKYIGNRESRFALSFNYFYTAKDLERRSGLYENDILNPISPVEGRFRAYDFALSANYAFIYDYRTYMGAGLKFISQTIDNESAYSFALDLGIIRSVEFKEKLFDVGFAVKNIGPGIKFDKKRFDLPLTFALGISHRILETQTLLSFDILKYIDNYPYFMFGMEQAVSSKFFIRAGYKYRLYGNELGAFSGFSTGIGFNYENYSFDYAFTPYSDFGYSHKLSLTYRFPVKKSAVQKKEEEIKRTDEKSENVKAYLCKTDIKPLKIKAGYGEYMVSCNNMNIPVSFSFKAIARSKIEIGDVYYVERDTSSYVSEFGGDYRVEKAFSIIINTRVMGDIKLVFKNFKNSDFKIAYKKRGKVDYADFTLEGDNFVSYLPSADIYFILVPDR